MCFSFSDMPVWQSAMAVAERVFAPTDDLQRKDKMISMARELGYPLKAV